MTTKNSIRVAMLFAVGGFAGWLLNPSGHQAEQSSSTSVTSSSRARTISSRSGGGGLVDTRMQAIENSESEHERLSLVVDLVETIPISQAGRWLDEGLFSQREGFAIVLFTRMLEKRWRREDPEGFFLWQLKHGKEISKEDMTLFAGKSPERLLKQIREISNPDAMGEAMSNFSKAHPELVLSELLKNDWGTLTRSGTLSFVLRELAKADLVGLKSALNDLPLSMQSEARMAVYNQLLQNDFSGTLDQLLEMRDGEDILTRFANIRAKERTILLERFSGLPESLQVRLVQNEKLTSGMKPDEILATDWSSYGLSGKQSGGIKGMALFGQVRHNRDEALALFQNAGLNGIGTQRFLDLLRMNGGLEIIADLIPHLNESDRDYISQKMNKAGPLPKSDPKTAAELSQILAQSESRDFGRVGRLMRGWNEEQKAQFESDYSTMQGDERYRVTAMLVDADDLETRAAAVSELLGIPEAQEIAGWQNGRGSKFASQVVLELFKRNAEQAVDWVKSLPEGSDRIWAMRNLAGNWKNYEPDRAEVFVNSLQPSEREAVSSFLK